MKRKLEISLPIINNILCDDVLNIVFFESNNPNCILVCKQWYNTILKSSKICVNCNKITQIYDNVMWSSDNDDDNCHEFYGCQENYETIKAMLNECPLFFSKIQTQSSSLCKIAVKNLDSNLKFVKNQIEEICMISINHCSACIEYVRPENRTEYLCLEALAKSQSNFKHVLDCYKTEYMCFNYLKYSRTDFELIPEHLQSERICLLAVKNYGRDLKHVKYQNEKICLTAVKESGLALKYVHHQTKKICLMAVKSNSASIQYVINQTEKLCLIAIKDNINNLQYIHNQTEKLCLMAIQMNINSIKYIRNPTDNIINYVINKGPNYWYYINNIPQDKYIELYKKDNKAFHKLIYG